MNALHAHAKTVEAGDAFRHENETHTGFVGLAVSLKNAAIVSLGAEGNRRHQAGDSCPEDNDLHELILAVPLLDEASLGAGVFLEQRLFIVPKGLGIAQLHSK